MGHGRVSFDLLNMLSFHSSILFVLINAILFANHLTSALPERSRVTLCEFTINGLVNVLSNSPSLEEQATFLLPICDQLTDEASLKKCRREVDAYWNYLAPPLYAAYIGGAVGNICDTQLPTEDECFRCQQRVGLVAELVTSEEVVAGMVGMVQVDDDDDDDHEDDNEVDNHHHHFHHLQVGVVLQHGGLLLGFVIIIIIFTLTSITNIIIIIIIIIITTSIINIIIIIIIISIKGELFCNMEGHWWDVEQCEAEWAWFMPQAMSAISSYLSFEDWQWNFCEITAGVCHS